MTGTGLARIEFRALGSACTALLDAPSPCAETALTAVPRWFRRWERCLSRFDPGSELCRLNCSAGSPMRVSPILFRALEAGLCAARRTAGLVTPTLLDALRRAGYDRSFELLERGGALPSGGAPPTGSHRAVGLDKGERTVTLPPGIGFDLGGTAKGWAADRAAARLGRRGAALVDAGGDIAVSGPRAGGGPWPIAVTSPHRPEESLGLLLVERGGVATSGRDRRRWLRGGGWQHHILDPRTGRPAVTDVLTATVAGRSALEAEVAAKVVLILGSRDGLRWIESQPSGAALIVREDGAVLTSRRTEDIFRASPAP